MNTIVLIAAALSAAGSTAAISAETSFGTYQSAVSTAGLNLSTQRGVRALDLRVLHAATALCDVSSTTYSLGAAKAKQCRDQALTTVAAERARIISLAQRNAAQTAGR